MTIVAGSSTTPKVYMNKNIAFEVAEARIRAEKKARADQKAYIREYFSGSRKIVRWVRSNSTEAHLLLLVIFLCVAAIIILIGLFIKTNVLGWLVLFDLVFFASGFVFITLVEGRKSSIFAMYFWQKTAEYLPGEAALSGLSAKELRVGLRAISESRKVEERFILGAIAIIPAIWAVADELYEENPIKQFVLINFPYAENWLVWALILTVFVIIFLVRYFAPDQWDRQLNAYLKDSAEDE